MIDIEIIRASYAKMQDDELRKFAETESKGLTQKAFIVLKQEMRRRGISSALINEIEAERVEVSIEKIKNNQQQFEWENYKKLWGFILNKKYENIPDEDLGKDLKEQGYSTNEVNALLGSVERVALKLLDDAKSEQISGAIILLAGIIAIVIFSDSANDNLITRLSLKITPYMILGIGIIRLLIGSTNISRYKIILSNIEEALQNDEAA